MNSANYTQSSIDSVLACEAAAFNAKLIKAAKARRKAEKARRKAGKGKADRPTARKPKRTARTFAPVEIGGVDLTGTDAAQTREQERDA